jgi:hypothetical protein
MDQDYEPPTLDEVLDEADSIGLDEKHAQEFFDFYSPHNWRVSGSRVNWKRKLQLWLMVRSTHLKSSK